MTAKIAPSILSADFVNLEKELNRIKDADLVHVDVMDNHFVPNLTLGLPIVKRIIEVSPIPVDVHLMIANPDLWAPQYASAGAHSVTFHAEAASAPIRLAREIRSLGCQVAIALKPATAIEPYLDFLGEFDMVLIMSVEPGFGGQSFIPQVLSKARAAKERIERDGLKTALQIDGGINTKTIALAAEAGIEIFVAGSAVYDSENPGQEIETLRNLAKLTTIN